MFQGATHFTSLFWLVIIAALLARRQLGYSGMLALAVGLYYLLYFYNAMERRDRRDKIRRE